MLDNQVINMLALIFALIGSVAISVGISINYGYGGDKTAIIMCSIVALYAILNIINFLFMG